jgi:hypothetical protein
MLVEIMMSALLIAIAATAVFKGIDGANATSGQSKSRAIATSLVHEDQERLRSMDPRKLAAYSPAPVQKVVNAVQYTITSSASFVSDRGQGESCTRGDGRVTYVRIKSTVTWPQMHGSKPVNAASLIAINNAYSKGSLAVKVQDRNAAGVPGVAVSVTNPTALSGSTNSAGCVVWDGLDTGSYFGSFSKQGYVDPTGQNLVAPVNGWSVTTGSTGVATHLYDLAGNANFTFVGKLGSTTYAGAQARGITVKHLNMPTAGNVRSATFTANNAVNFTDLFPFLTPYAAYAGACDDNAPPTGGAASVTVPAGSLATPNPVTIEMPVINVRVRRSSANYGGADVTVRPVDPACGGTVTLPDSDAGGIPGTGTDRAFPYGSYMVCADDNLSNGRRVEQQINLTTTAAGTATDLVIPTSGSSSRGSC